MSWCRRIRRRYFSAKVSSGEIRPEPGQPASTHRVAEQHAERIVARPPFDEEPEAVRQYVASDAWRSRNALDNELYEHAERRLDEQIERIGADRFREALQQFEGELDAVRACCGREARDAASCLWKDHGCGHKCMSAFAEGGMQQGQCSGGYHPSGGAAASPTAEP